MGLFGGNKKSRDDVIAEGIATAEAEALSNDQDKKDDSFSSGNPKVDMEITKIKAQLESYGEIRKANSERFSRVSEQIGELRGMVMDTNKTMSKIEVSATKAIDMVESVKPEKLMIEIRRMDGKVEALKANIESNESMMKDLFSEIKKMRQQMNFYKGIEQVAKLNEDVKGEILEIKKVEANIELHADKGESIFLDLEKKFANFEKFESTVDDINKEYKVIRGDADKLRLEINKKSTKKDFVNLMDKFQEFEKHTGNILKLLDERSKHAKLEMKEMLKKIKHQLKRKHNILLDEEDIKQEELPSDEKEFLDKASSGKKESIVVSESETPASAEIPVAAPASESESSTEDIPHVELPEAPASEESASTSESKPESESKAELSSSSEKPSEEKPKEKKKGKKSLKDVFKIRNIISHKLGKDKEAEPSPEAKSE